MLSIGAMKGGQHSYYLELAREDYYLNGGEPPGHWHGQGAASLGLSGEVTADALTRLFEGYHPTEPRSLIQQQKYQDGKRAHRPGWDLTFSAPKSVSVLWSQADFETRQAIQSAHFAAVKAALNYLEDEAAITRCGKGGREKVKANLVVATFEHHTSRAQDPQLHTHALVMNVCTHGEGRSGTVESRPLYRTKMAAGAVYRAELSAQLEHSLGLTSERHGNLFEVKGIPKSIITEFSKRRAEIEKVLTETGHTSAAAAAVAALDTRSTKGHVAQEELFPQWQQVGAAHGWGSAQANHLVRTAVAPRRNRQEEMSQALQRAAERATQQQSFFTVRDFTQLLAEECQGRRLGAKELRAARDSFLFNSPEIVKLGRYKREQVFTTQATLEEERALLQAVEKSQQAQQTGVSTQTAESVIATRQVFSDEQASALHHVTVAGGSIRMVAGMAGTGKTTLLHASRLAWELEGFNVYGAALSGQAAKGLERGSGIKSTTLHQTLMDLENGHLRLSEKSVLVVDEAAMVGTHMMHRVVEATEHAGARLVLVGDAGQLQPIDAGGPFAEMQRRLGASTLEDIKRQHEDWARDAVKKFAAGEAALGLRAYAERGLVEVCDDRRSAMESLIGSWKEQGIQRPGDQLILAGTRLEAAILNRMAQEERRKAGLLSGPSVAIPDSNESLATGDRVLFTQKSRLYGVENGDRGAVLAIDSEGLLSVRLDSGELVRFSLKHYEHVRPGYAMTTHKGQGATTENTFILAGGSMQDRELSYVQVSRSRRETRIFIDVEEAGESLTRLARQMSQSRQKEMAHTIRHRQQQNQSLRL